MSNIKGRVLRIAESKGINKTTFFKNLGLSYANFKGVQKTSSLSSDAIVTILSCYPDVNPAWLVTGKGDMYMDAPQAPLVAQEPGQRYLTSNLEEATQSLVLALEKVIAAQEATILSQAKTIASLEVQLTALAGQKGK